MASRQTVAQAVRAETSGDELLDLLVYVSRMPENELAVLQETDTSEFIVEFVRRVKAAGTAAGPGPGSMAAAGLLGLPPLHGLASGMMTQLRTMPKLPAAGEVLSLQPSGLLLDPKYDRVYIRDCYEPLFEKLRTITTTECKDIIVTGTPGIGKSWFLYYLLVRLVRLPEPPPYILWEHMTCRDKMWCYDCYSKVVRWGTRMSFESQLNHDNSWYISDGIPPDLSCRARIVLITTPCRKTYKEMQKSGAHTLYMPVWSLEELLDCRAKVYGDRVSEDLATRLYEHYGGVARYVLGVPSWARPSATWDTLLQPLTAALDGSSAAKVKESIGNLDTGPEASHQLLHIVTKDNFERSHVDFASPWVAECIVAKAMEDDPNGLSTLLAPGTKGAIRGRLYEQLMHRLLPQGGTFTVVPIRRDTLTRAEPEEELQLPSCTSRRFEDVVEISADGLSKAVYFRPVQPNFSTVDSLLVVDKTLHLFQITVDSSKAVSACALTSLFNKLGPGVSDLDLRLYYVVPPDTFMGFNLLPESGSWPPHDAQPHAARTRLYLLKGDMEARLQPQQRTGVSRYRPAATAAAARPAAMIAAAIVKRTAAPSSGRVR